MSDIGKINLNNLSDGLYKESVKLAKENKLEQNIDKLIKIAAKDGFTKDEKDFLEGLASTDNVVKLKDSNTNHLQSIDFVEPGFKENNTKETKPSSFLNMLSNGKQGLTENKNQLQTRANIAVTDYLDKEIDKMTKGMNKDLVNDIKNNLPSQIDQKKFLEIFNINSIKSMDTKQIKNVLSSGVLKAKDKDGNSTLNNLHDMAFKSPQKVSDNKQLVKDAIKLLQPGDEGRKEITQGNIHYTCGAASIEQYMKKFEPAELIRVVKDLAQKGESTLRGGQTIKAGTGSLDFRAGKEINATKNEIKKYGDGSGKVHENRSAFDIIFQSAAMRSIALIGGDMTGENTSAFSDLNILHKTGVIDLDYNLESDSDFSGVQKGNRGGHPGAIATFLEQTTGKKYDYEHSLTLNNQIGDFFAKGYLNLKDKQEDNSSLIDQLKTSLGKGKETVFVFGKDIDSLHYVTGLRFGKKDNQEGIFFVNTMAKTQEMTQKSKDEGSVTQDFMTIDDLKKKLQGVIFEK